MYYPLLKRSSTRASQNGSTLVVSLLLLMLMSMLGLGAMEAALLEEKMSSNFRFATEAFYAAEAGAQQAILNHRHNQLSATFSGSLGQSQFTTSVTSDAGEYTVESEGVHPPSGARHSVTLLLSGPLGTVPTIDRWSDHE